MPSADQITDDSRFLGLFVGESGSGKTAAALSFPHPIKVYDMDMNIRGGLTPWIERKGIDYETFPPKDGNIFQKLNDSFTVLQMQCKMGQGPKTLFFDTLTKSAVSFLLDAIPLTHVNNKGKSIGLLQMADPGDYGYQSTAISQIMAFLFSLPIPNIIVSAHIIPKYSKPRLPTGELNPYGENVIVGEKLALTDKLAATVPGGFTHIFKFEKRDSGSKLLFSFSAQGDLARTPFNIPYGDHDITGKDFYKTLMSFTKSSTPTVEVK